MLDTYKALTKTLKKKGGIWKSLYPWRKEWVFIERKKQKKFTHFEVFFNTLYKMKKIKNNPKNEEGKSKYMLYVWRVIKKTFVV